MSETEPNSPVVKSHESSNGETKPRVRQVVIRMWPKTPILYPMALVALICGIMTTFWGGEPKEKELTGLGGDGVSYAMAQLGVDGVDGEPAEGTGETPVVPTDTEVVPVDPATPPVEVEPADGEVVANPTLEESVIDGEDEGVEEAKPKGSLDRTLAVIFLSTMFLSLFTLCVNLDIRWGLIFVSSVVIFILIGVIANIYVDFITNFFGFMKYFNPAGNAQFYYGIFAVWVVLMAVSFLVSRFHYVRIEPNEVLVVGGMLERQQRYSTMRMRYTKEVQDVLEYYLPFVRSGRLILSFPEQNEAVIIDNVLNIKAVTDELDGLISSLQVIGD